MVIKIFASHENAHEPAPALLEVSGLPFHVSPCETAVVQNWQQTLRRVSLLMRGRDWIPEQGGLGGATAFVVYF